MNETNRLSYIRDYYELKQIEVAEKLHISREYYSCCETNREYIPLKYLNDFCNLYHVDMDYVFYLSNVPKRETTFSIKEIDKKECGERLRIVMALNRLTQNKLAKILNTSQSTISAYKNGKTMILTAFAIQLAKEYHFSLDWLVGREDKQIYIDAKLSSSNSSKLK